MHHPHLALLPASSSARATSRWLRANDPRGYWEIRAVELASLTTATGLAALVGAGLRAALHH